MFRLGKIAAAALSILSFSIACFASQIEVVEEDPHTGKEESKQSFLVGESSQQTFRVKGTKRMQSVIVVKDTNQNPVCTIDASTAKREGRQLSDVFTHLQLGKNLVCKKYVIDNEAVIDGHKGIQIILEEIGLADFPEALARSYAVEISFK
jgi:hypothetical protein